MPTLMGGGLNSAVRMGKKGNWEHPGSALQILQTNEEAQTRKLYCAFGRNMTLQKQRKIEIEIVGEN